MPTGTTLLQLRTSLGEAFDGSSRGIAVTPRGNVLAEGDAGSLRLNGGALEIARHPALDDLQSFTIDATITPEQVGRERRNIAEAQKPPVALFLDAEGRLVGSVHTAAGWVSVDSGEARIAAGRTTRVRMTRNARGRTELLIDDRKVGHKDVAGPLVPVGEMGFRVGTWVDGRRFPFVGRIAGFDIREGVVAANALEQLRTQAQSITTQFKQKTGLSRVVVSLIPDESRARLQPIRDILMAAGVDKLSDLTTLQITQPTTITPGQVIIAPRASSGMKVDWSSVASTFLTAGTAAARRATLAESLANRNSRTVLEAMVKPAPQPAPAAGTGRTIRLTGGRMLAGPFNPRTGRVEATPAEEAANRLPLELRRDNPVLRRTLETPTLAELFIRERGKPKLIDPKLLELLEADDPSSWPVAKQPAMKLMTLRSIPMDSAVIIAHRLDLTNTELRIVPSVNKLYIIAEEVICGANARITWQRPGGTTPARADNPDLNGRSWHGVHTKPGSRDGMDGGHGRAGESGIGGAAGRDAPELEMWAKTLTAIPNLDLNGEDGRTGGRGQRGGAGGRGANGATGERIWFFGWHCTARPGHGGHGGNGTTGGPGGRGGDGGGGGNVTIGVLQGTLAATVTSKSFRIQNQGGARGQGGDGGPGGAGGAGGRAGIGETCKDARHGQNGAQGQPGARGAQAHAAGMDGEVTLFEFTQDAWEELLTRPWITQLVPSEVFPGDQLTIRGSRFASTDRVHVGSVVLSPTVNPDESLSIQVPITTPGGSRSIHVRRVDGTESNRLNVGVNPRLDVLPASLAPGAQITVQGHAFVNGASVLVNGAAVHTTFETTERLRFTMPGTGGAGSPGGTVTVQVRNPDGRVSNPRVATRPRILEIPFIYGTHNLTFPNFTDGIPSWSTFEQTFGTAEVWHELLDPIFGHPVLTAVYFGFYMHFLKGTANGGLATGFCTSLAATVADRFWEGHTNQTTLTKAPLHAMLTAVHGKLLSRESLIHFHDQGREGVARVDRTARAIEATFLRGTDRNNQPLLFFIPSGAAWDAGYFDRLSDSHCVMPYRFVYPDGHPGPVLSPDQSSTITSLDGVQMFVWDCNAPESQECRLEFRTVGGVLHFDYVNGNGVVQFSSTDGITLGVMTNGEYLLADHDLPFSGPFGLTRFVVDFLLSPADLQITDGVGLRTGNFGGQILSEIPGSHPAYLVPGMYLLPMDMALTRKIVGNGTGTYTYNTLLPEGASLVLEGVSTTPGEEDAVAVNADGTQIRFTPGTAKTFALTLARRVDGQARAIAVEGVAGAPGEEVDITISPELSLVRLGNRGADRAVTVKAFSIDRNTNTPVRKSFAGVNVPHDHDLVVAVANWGTLQMDVTALGFE